MKILHVGKYFSPFSGGLENYMHDAMVALGRRGIVSGALVHQHNLSLKSSRESFTSSGHKLPVVRAGVWARFLFTPLSPFFPWHLRRMIRSFKPDLLHLHMPNPSAFWALALPAARLLPWVVHWHADVITAAQGRWMKLFYFFYRPFERALLRRAGAVVVTSPPYLASSQPLAPWRSKCHVVPLGVDKARFESLSGADSRRTSETGAVTGSYSKPGVGSPSLKVLAVGRLTYYKGFRYLLEAAARVENVHVDLVGHGEQAEELAARVVSLGLQDRVKFHASLDNAALRLKMESCDCLCLPSIERTEAFGMVLLEAMYFAKATLISDVPGSGMGWVVEHGNTGIKVPPMIVDALAAALRDLSENRHKLKRMGRMGKQKFDEQFEIDHAVEPLIDVYRQVLAVL